MMHGRSEQLIVASGFNADARRERFAIDQMRPQMRAMAFAGGRASRR